MNLNYFTLSEFDSPDLPNSGINMDKQFLAKLETAREYASIPFKISSGYRSAEHNAKVGGVSDSAHTKGLAADIKAVGSRKRFQILKGMMDAGFNRMGIGFGDEFIHVDLDSNKDKDVVWGY